MASCRAFNNLLALFLCLGLLFFTCKSENNARSEEDVVSTACKHTLYYEICVSSLRSDPGSQTTSYLGDLATISLNVSIAYAMDTLSYINGLKAQAPESQTMYSCLSDCQEEYEDAIENLQEAVDALKKKNYDNVNSLVSAAMTDSDTCADGFKEMSLSDSTDLSVKNQYFYKLCSNSLAISTLLN